MITLKGKCSWFGGPNDHGVGPHEGLALIQPDQIDQFAELEIFLPQQPQGTTGLARRLNPKAHFCACRFDYKVTPIAWLLGNGITIHNPRTHMLISGVQAVDWGPNERTGRVADLSLGLVNDLGLQTDDICIVEIPTPPAHVAAAAPGFDTWMPFILHDEGEEINESPDEPGGISKYGISLLALSDYYKTLNPQSPGATISDVRILGVPAAMAFYAWFFEPFALDQFPAAIAYRIADLVTTLGHNGALEAIYVAMGIWPIATAMTPDLVAQINACDQKSLLWGLSGVWLATKRTQGGVVGKAKYSNGWNNRRNEVFQRCLTMI